MVVNPDGSLEFVYDDAVAKALGNLGPMETKRASHVEPHPTKPGWLADMQPSGGPVLGADGSSCLFATADGIAICQHHGCRLEHRPHRGWYCDPSGRLIPFGATFGSEHVEPFETRREAIDAELAWLREHRGL